MGDVAEGIGEYGPEDKDKAPASLLERKIKM